MEIVIRVVSLLFFIAIEMTISIVSMKIKRKRQYTFIYCCNCNNELISSNSFVKDEEGIVTYKCSKCGLVKKYDFIHYPVPVRIN